MKASPRGESAQVLCTGSTATYSKEKHKAIPSSAAAQAAAYIKATYLERLPGAAAQAQHTAAHINAYKIMKF